MRNRRYKVGIYLLVFVGMFLFTCFISYNAVALPFNDDMANMESMKPGEIARELPEGSVPVGAGDRLIIRNKKDALDLKNPNGDGNTRAVLNGQKLFFINCTPCHGQFEVGRKIKKGKVAERTIMEGPDLTNEYYVNKSDGFFYGTIEFGGAALMPPLGYKFSPQEIWDIVSYIRHIQGK